MKLELMQGSHVEAVARLASASDISNTSGVPKNCNIDDVKLWCIDSQISGAQEMHFVVSESDNIYGCCILKKINRDNGSAELAYWLGVDFWGKGIGT
jgi:RimJ/RimL family protein N-acetyltransferase